MNPFHWLIRKNTHTRLHSCRRNQNTVLSRPDCSVLHEFLNGKRISYTELTCFWRSLKHVATVKAACIFLSKSSLDEYLWIFMCQEKVLLSKNSFRMYDCEGATCQHKRPNIWVCFPLCFLSKRRRISAYGESNTVQRATAWFGYGGTPQIDGGGLTWYQWPNDICKQQMLDHDSYVWTPRFVLHTRQCFCYLTDTITVPGWSVPTLVQWPE